MARPASTWFDGFLALTVATAVAATEVAADVRVTKSNEPTIKKGTVLKDDAVLDIPANRTVKVFLTPSNVSKVLTGPYKGTAPEFQPTVTAAKPAFQFPAGVTLGSPGPPHH